MTFACSFPDNIKREPCKKSKRNMKVLNCDTIFFSKTILIDTLIDLLRSNLVMSILISAHTDTYQKSIEVFSPPSLLFLLLWLVFEGERFLRNCKAYFVYLGDNLNCLFGKKFPFLKFCAFRLLEERNRKESK